METGISTSTARAETVAEISAPPTAPFVEDPEDPPGGPPRLALSLTSRFDYLLFLC